MKPIRAVVMSMGMLLWATTAYAHEVTYTGTVVAVEPNQYVAATGVLARIEIKLTDSEGTKVFDIVQFKTKVFRGDTEMSLAQARIQTDERVAVTINHEEPGGGALEVRLAARDAE